MAAKALGLVGIVDKGTYDSNITYQKGNFVYYLGSTYLCLLSGISGVTPTNDGVNWKYLARGFEEVDSVVLEDDTTGIKYKVGVIGGELYIQESSADPNSIFLTDLTDQKKYKLGINEEKLYIQAVDS